MWGLFTGAGLDLIPTVDEIQKYSVLMFDTNNWPLMSDNVTTRFWPRQDFCSN